VTDVVMDFSTMMSENLPIKDDSVFTKLRCMVCNIRLSR